MTRLAALLERIAAAFDDALCRLTDLTTDPED